MKHLHESEFIDLLDGTVPPPAHVDACATCRSRLESLREARRLADVDRVPEPPGLFWEHFAARVNARIDAPEPPRRSSWWPAFVLAPAAAVVVAIIAFALFAGGPREEPVRPAVVADAPSPVLGLEADDLEADAEWAVVRAAAGDLRPEDAAAEGLALRPGTVERVALELNEAERAELVRLVELELKRSGA